MAEHTPKPDQLSKPDVTGTDEASPAIKKADAAVKRSMPMALSVAIGIVLAIFVAWLFSALTWWILLLYLCFVIATIVEAPVHAMSRWIPRWLATLLVLASALAALTAVGYLLTTNLSNQLVALSDDLSRIPERLTEMVNNLRNRFPGLGGRFRDVDLDNFISSQIPTADTVVTNLTWTFEIATYVVVAFFVVLYMVIDGPSHLKNARRVLPKDIRLEATRVFTDMATTHRHWFLASMGNVLSAATLTGAGLWYLGVPGALVLATIAGLGELVPNVGPVIGALPTILLVLLLEPDKLLWVVGLFLVVQTIQSYTITPMLMKVGVQLPVLATIISVITMGLLFGFLGVLVAIPLVADLGVLWNFINARMEKDTTDYDRTNSPPPPARTTSLATSINGGRRGFFWRRRAREEEPPKDQGKRENPDERGQKPEARSQKPE